MIINEEPMILSKWEPKNLIEIWQPRYHDKKVLINPAKVGRHNKVIFTKAPSLTGTYYLSGEKIKKYPKESNGTIMCYCVDVSELRPLEETIKDMRSLI